MPIQSKSQYRNYLAIELLEHIGNDQPTQDQIDFMESLIPISAIEHQSESENVFTEKEIAYLQLRAMDRKRREIMAILNMTLEQLNQCHQSVLRKLRCTTLTATMAMAIEKKLLQLPSCANDKNKNQQN